MPYADQITEIAITCASISEIPSNPCTMVPTMNTDGETFTFQLSCSALFQPANRFADPSGIYPDPDLTLEKNPDPSFDKKTGSGFNL